MIRKLFGLLFSCRHKRISWPQMKKDHTGRRLGDYVCCLDCGQEFDDFTFQAAPATSAPRTVLPRSGDRHHAGNKAD